MTDEDVSIDTLCVCGHRNGVHSLGEDKYSRDCHGTQKPQVEDVRIEYISDCSCKNFCTVSEANRVAAEEAYFREIIEAI